MNELYDLKQLKKRKVIVTALACVLFFTSMVGLYHYWDKNVNDQERLTRKANEIMRVKEVAAESILSKLASVSIGFDSAEDYFQWGEEAALSREGISILVYRGDSMIYWSDHRYAPLNMVPAFLDNKPFAFLGNAWYRIKETRQGPLTLVALILVRSEFPYQNDFLVNAFQKDFALPSTTGLSTVRGDHPVFSPDGTYLFNLDFKAAGAMGTREQFILASLFMAGSIFLLLLLYYAYRAFTYLNERKLLFLLAFLGDLVILRLLMLWLKIPAFLFESPLFGPQYFATSWWSPSLGDLVLNSLFILFYSFVFYQNFRGIGMPSRKGMRLAGSYLLLALTMLMLFGLADAIRVLVTDSSIVLNLNNIFNIDGYSILGFIALTSSVLAFFLVTAPLCRESFDLSGSRRRFMLVATAVAIPAAIILASVQAGPKSWGAWVTGAAYMMSFAYFLPREEQFRTLPGAVFYIILFAVMTTFLLDTYHLEKEKEYRKLLASDLATRRDPMLEFEFSSLRGKILHDDAFKNILLSSVNDQPAITYLEENYFTGFWNRYEIQVTPCHREEMLNIQPDNYLVGCDEYFTGLIRSFGQVSQDSGLWFIDRKTENSNYLAIFRYDSGQASPMTVYIEFFSKLVAETGLGYPDMLIDKNARLTTDLQYYSYARYYQDKLVYKFGDYSYGLGIQAFKGGSNSYFLNDGGYSHYIERTDPDNVLVISRKMPGLLDLVAPFSYLFLFYGVFLLVFVLAVMLPDGFRDIELNFRNRLQGSIIFLIILSFIVIGFITRSSIIRLNNNKNRDNLSEKAFSVLVEMEHKLGGEPALTADMESYLGSLLNKFSQVFFSDINVYDPSGSLIASSRPQIFEESLLSRKMHPVAYHRLVLGAQLLFIQKEMIGRQDYLSAYLPFRNNRDRIIGYLNLPYFAKQNELQAEIADFIAAFINTYVLLIVLAVLLTIFVSRYITQPLKLIREKMGKVVYGRPNEKIEWKREDEIGSLVAEYNRMLDELARSAELLARSERESAWREMAMQVAHEIKNPLTPMKLSVQHLKRAWEDSPADFNHRLTRFTQTIVEQIESLAEIATAFSDFARMPSGNPEPTEIGSIVMHASELFADQQNIRFTIDFRPPECPIIADPKQLLRVFNNLIRNAIEAIGRKEDGEIAVRARINGAYYEVEVSDNGSGMTEEQQAKVFSPSFTTKTGGMGLGLAMVRSIINSMGGTISFSSVYGRGTTFTMTLPRPGVRNIRP